MKPINLAKRNRYQTWRYRRGDLYMANLNPFTGCEQGGTRPVLVIQNNDGNYYCPTLIVAVLTSQLKNQWMPTHYIIEDRRILDLPSMIEFEQIRTIDKSRIKSYLGKLTPQQMSEADDYLRNSLNLYIPETNEAP